MRTQIPQMPCLVWRFTAAVVHAGAIPASRARKLISPSSWLKPPPTSPAKAASHSGGSRNWRASLASGARKQIEAGLVRLLAPTVHLRGAPLRLQAIGHYRQQARACRPWRAVEERRDRRHRVPGPDHLPARQSRRHPARRAPFRARHGPHPDHQYAGRPPGREGGEIAGADGGGSGLGGREGWHSGAWARSATRRPGRRSTRWPSAPTPASRRP